jgi:hypothetical protein
LEQGTELPDLPPERCHSRFRAAQVLERQETRPTVTDYILKGY